MKKILCILVGLTLFVGLSQAQVVTQQKWMVPLVINTTDTIPGTETGGSGVAASGWYFVGDNDVVYSVTSLDSTHFTVTIDYTDSMGITVPSKSYLVTLATDSVANFANEANPQNFTSRVIRQKGYVDNIPGGRYIRFRLFGVNVASKFAGTAAGRTVRLICRTIRYAGN